MTAAEKVEQRFTGRPDSYVPARTLLHLLGRDPGDGARPRSWNLGMHYGTGIALGTLRGVWAAVGLNGPQAHVAFTVVRLATDQTLENATGVGAPPSTWPRHEWLADLGHKAVYATVSGLVAQRLVPPRLQSRRGSRSH